MSRQWQEHDRPELFAGDEYYLPDGGCQQQAEYDLAERWSAPIGFRCVYCGTAHAARGDCQFGADIACCGEVGHCTPIYRGEDNDD